MERKLGTSEATMSRRGFLGMSALAGVGLAGGSSLLSACGSGGGSGAGEVSWASWANPGEAARYKAFSTHYEKARKGVDVSWQQVVGDYQTKMMSQLAGGVAPDAFYVGDSQMAKFVSTNQLVDLTSYLASDKSPVKETDFFPGLMDWCYSPDGKGLYGVPVDCNPKIFWFNEDVLGQAGVSQTPAQMFEAGTWNQDGITSMLDKIRSSTGKYGMVLEANWFDLFGWITTFGGTVVDEDGTAVFDTDPKAQAALEWLFDQLDSGNISFAGSLPKGQGVDALFYSGQLATIQYGRWILPNLQDVGFGYDVAPMPSESGKDISSVPIYTAAISVNANAGDQDAALEFLGNYVSAEGQRFRLSGSGNAVPSVGGLDGVVTADNDPEHDELFTQIAQKGYAIPTTLAHDAEVAADFPLEIDAMLKSKSETPASFSQKLVQMLNA